jgi:hypothetical protein
MGRLSNLQQEMLMIPLDDQWPMRMEILISNFFDKW